MVAYDTIVNAGLSASTATIYDTIVKASLSATEPDLISVTLGPDLGGLEPYSTVHLDAVVTNGVGSTLLIEQIAGESVSILGTAPSWTYKTPAVLEEQGTLLVFRVTATLGSDVDIAEVHHQIYPNTIGYYNTAGQLLSAQWTNTVEEAAPTIPFPDAGLNPDSGILLRS